MLTFKKPCNNIPFCKKKQVMAHTKWNISSSSHMAVLLEWQIRGGDLKKNYNDICHFQSAKWHCLAAIEFFLAATLHQISVFYEFDRVKNNFSFSFGQCCRLCRMKQKDGGLFLVGKGALRPPVHPSLCQLFTGFTSFSAANLFFPFHSANAVAFAE
jgi:hypothetical protein